MEHVHNHCRWFATLMLIVFSQFQGIAADWLCFTAETDGSKFWYENNDASYHDPDLWYSTDGGETWTELSESNIVTLNKAGDKVHLKGDNPDGFSVRDQYSRDFYISSFKMEGRIAASGNVLSLLYGDEEPDPEEALPSQCFRELFVDCESLTQAPELTATKLGNSCYNSMFKGCVNLREAPALPASFMVQECYYMMFSGCTSLTQTPEITISSANKYCMYGMFSGCENIVEAPVSLTDGGYEGCFGHMFSGCTSLTHTPELSLMITKYTQDNTFEGMFEGCTSLKRMDVSVSCSYLDEAPRGLDGFVSGVDREGVLYTQCIAEADALSAPESSDLYYVRPSDLLSYITPTNFHVVSAPIVIFRNQDGTELKRDTIRCGGIPDYGEEDPFLDDEHRFVKWDKELTKLSEPDYYYYTAEYEEIEDLSNCLQFTAKAANSTFSIVHYNGNNPDIHYSLDGGRTWQPLEGNTEVTLHKIGDTAYIKGNNPNGFSTDVSIYSTFVMSSGLIAASGSVMSLLDETGEATTIPNNYCFTKLFNGCQTLTQAPELPATTLTESCYESMFSGCMNLTKAPVLPATELASSCYHDMFSSCVGLTSAPELPATKLAPACYSAMFTYCLNLQNSPEILPATELKELCYENMFRNCESLVKAPELPSTQLADYCYNSMFTFCPSLVEAPRLPALVMKRMCYTSMFSGCTSLTQAPELPALELADGCYSDMFSGCTGLTEAPVLPATNMTYFCYSGMFAYCTELTQAPELIATRLAQGCYNYMFRECSKITHIKVGVMDLDEVEATDDWVAGIKGEGLFEFPCGSKYNIRGDSSVPMNFTIKSSPIVIFQNSDGSVIYQDTVCNVVPECPIIPSAGEGKVFKGWEPEPTLVDDPEKTYYYTAIYEENNKPGNWLCFTAKDANATVSYNRGNCFVDMQYSNDDGKSWHPWEPNEVLTLPQVDSKIYIKGDNPYSFSMSAQMYVNFTMEGRIAASGSVMSLIDGEGVTLEIPNAFCFNGLFYGCSDLVQAPELPATKLADNCYHSMFTSCTSLTKAPALPATELTDNCYDNMFAFCDKLKIAPKLPATQLAESCYSQMFKQCTSLEQAPELPATEMKISCYKYMFEGCGLKEAPELPATKLSQSCYTSMFSNCENLTKAPALPADSMEGNCYYGMFSHCMSLQEAPDLPAHTLADWCYGSMFADCQNLIRAPQLPATEMKNRCYVDMFSRCFLLTEAPELPAMELEVNCYEGMFSQCHSLVSAPELPATELKSECYKSMFYQCTSLNYIKVGVLTLDNDFNATRGWVTRVDGPGVFIFPCGSKYDKHGTAAVPDSFQIISSPIVIFQDQDGTEIYRDTVMCDVIPECPIIPTAGEGLVFKGWDPEPYPATDPSETYYYTAMYEKEGGDTVPNNWLCFTAEVGGSTVWYENYEENNPDVRYSIDGGVTWQALDSMQKITLENKGDRVYIKGYNPDGFSHGDDAYTKFNMTGFVSASGSVMSLIDSVGATTVIPCSKCFSQLFAGNERLVKAPELPATTLTPGCYWYMFSECTKLEEAPELPATQLDTACYGGMFSGCASLTQAPELPATELKPVCYGSMFNCCRSLIQAPELPATQLAGGCYLCMFNLCSKLQVAPELPATQMKNGCYMRMFSGCASLTQAPELPATQLADSCYQGMFRSCTRLTLAPELPASQLAGKCYMSMFSNCTSLTQTPELPATQLASHCYEGMFEGCDNITQAPELNATNLVEGCYSHMFANCTALNYIKVGVMTLDNVFDATLDWVEGVDGPGVFIFPCGSTYDKHGNSEVPMNFEIGGYAYTIDSTIIAEGSYTRDGITYTESTSWTDSLQTAFGCDSVINYRLVIDGVTPAPVVHKDTAACDLFTFKDAVYTKDASWNDTLHTDSGDSIIVYHLTIHKSSMKDSTITAEGSFTWEGTTYTENTSWTETLQTIHGCDSIINYHLEIKDITTIPAVFTDKDTAACDMLVFKEITYTEDASWNDTLQAISGGDSIVIYHLTIHKGVTVDSTIIAEESFTWKDITYTESATWNDTLQTIHGCDSIVNYHLVIDNVNPVPVVHKDTSACDVFVLRNNTYLKNATWNDTLQTASGGDSIVVYHLTIHNSSVVDSTIIAEESFTWQGITFTESATWNDTLQTIHGCDSIVNYRLVIDNVNPVSIVHKDTSACDVFVLGNNTYLKDATWNDTLQTASGGDSIVIYHLTLHKSVTIDSTIMAEESFTWKDITFTESTTWSDTLQNLFGCDSIVRYRLIINGIIPTPITETNLSGCDPFLFNGTIFHESTSWNDTLQTASGGDSIVVYHLTIHKSSVTDSTIVTNENFTWQGITYTEDATWNDTLQNAFGCDSIVRYNLIINDISHTPITETNLSGCAPFLYNGTIFNESTSWNDTLQTASGSDSIVVYHLTIHHSSVVDTTITVEESFIWQGIIYTESTTWSDTLQNAFGCDSIVNYQLIVNKEKDLLQLTVEDELILVLPGSTTAVGYELTGGDGTKYEVRHNNQTISSGDVTNDSTVNLTCPTNLEPGAYTATLTMYDDEGEKTEREFKFNVMLPDNKQKSFYTKVWNDVVICRNGDGQFLSYQWYKNRKKCEGATLQYFNDLTLLDGEYMVYVNDKSGKSYFIEPYIFTPAKAAYAITATPNVVKRSEDFTVTVTGVEADDLQDARIVVYRADGVVEKILDEVKEEITMHLRNGEYIFVLTLHDGYNANCKVLVK